MRLLFCRLRQRTSIVVNRVMHSDRFLSRNRVELPPKAGPIVNFRSSQTDTQLRARDLQRTNGHVEYLSDLFSALSPLHEISNLLKSLQRELCRPTTACQQLRAELRLRSRG